nr:hypothetical protein [Burkholderia ubonensis]
MNEHQLCHLPSPEWYPRAYFKRCCGLHRPPRAHLVAGHRASRGMRHCEVTVALNPRLSVRYIRNIRCPAPIMLRGQLKMELVRRQARIESDVDARCKAGRRDLGKPLIAEPDNVRDGSAGLDALGIKPDGGASREAGGGGMLRGKRTANREPL